MTLPKLEAKFSTQLATRLSATGDTFNLVSYKDRNGDNLEGEYGFLIDGETSLAEFLIGDIEDGVVTIVKRGLDFSDGTTEKEALVFEHVRGATVKITDFPILGQLREFVDSFQKGALELEEILSYDDDKTFDDDKQLVAKKYVDDELTTEMAKTVKNTGNETVAGVKTFSSSPIVPTPTTDYQAATKKYIDDTAIAGAANASTSVKGISKLTTEPTDPNDPIAVGANDVAETGASKVVRLKSNGKLNTTVLPVLAKGDILVANGTNYDTALPVGTNGQSLFADSSEALGVKWADSAPYPIIRDYLTQYRPLFFRVGSLTGDPDVYVSFNNAKDSYRDFALWIVYTNGGVKYRYIKRDDNGLFVAPNMNPNGDPTDCATVARVGIYNVTPFGDFAYAFGWNYNNILTCARFPVDQNTGAASLSTVLIDSTGGGTLNGESDWSTTPARVLFSKTHLFLTTTTSNTWNKYVLNEDGTPTWECVGTVTMPTGSESTDIRQGDWTYLPGTSPEEWVFFRRGGGIINPYQQYRKYIAGQSSSKLAYTNTHAYNQFTATNNDITEKILRLPVLGIRDSMYELMTIERYWNSGVSYSSVVISGIFEPLKDLPTFS